MKNQSNSINNESVNNNLVENEEDIYLNDLGFNSENESEDEDEIIIEDFDIDYDLFNGTSNKGSDNGAYSTSIDDSVISLSDEDELEYENMNITPMEALVISFTKKLMCDLDFMEKISGISKDQLIEELRGKAIWQNPDFFDRYKDPYDGWLIKAQYINGKNIQKLLKRARELNVKYNCFDANIEMLEKELPEMPKLEDVAIQIGSSWIPPFYYSKFLQELLNMGMPPKIKYDELNKKYEIDTYYEPSRIENYYTYGTLSKSAIKIVTALLNNTPLAVYDNEKTGKLTKGGNFQTQRIYNHEQTLAVRNKANLLNDEFWKWIFSNEEAVERLKEVYDEQYAYKLTTYDGSFLHFKGMNPNVNLYKHQKDAIARILLSKNVLVAHDVGAGKSFIIITGARELVRMGIVKKVLVVLPNQVFDKMLEMYHLLFPNANEQSVCPVLAVSPKDFERKNRAETYQKMKDMKEGVIYIAYSALDAMSVSPQYYLNKQKEEIDLYAAADAKQRRTSHNKKGKYENKLKKLREAYEEDLVKAQEVKALEDCCYLDELKIEAVFVDEAHNFKNITMDRSVADVVGFHKKGSKRCDTLKAFTDYLNENGGRVIFATGTPLTNSLSDLYVLQRYLQPMELELCNIHTFADWLNTFCEQDTYFEVGIDSTSYKAKTKYNKFHNLPELMNLFSGVCDFYYSGSDELGLPKFDGYTDIEVTKNEEQVKIFKELFTRNEMIHAKKPVKKHSHTNIKANNTVSGVSSNQSTVNVKSDASGEQDEMNNKIDNPLKITVDGRRAALDARLYPVLSAEQRRLIEAYIKETQGSEAEVIVYEPGENIDKMDGKVQVCARKVFEIYQNHPDCSQVVFSDISTPKFGFNVYDALKEELCKLGMKEVEIAFIHDAKTDRQRMKLLDDLNENKLRVMIGSTSKLGTGVNIQKHLIAIHHLDVPWRPSDMVQREGRLIRQGNNNEKVYVFRYLTKDTFDLYNWQLLESKQQFISSFLKGTMSITHREEKDIDDMVLNYGEAKALCIGNPLVKKRVEVSNNLDRARIAKKQRQAQIAGLEEILRALPGKIVDDKATVKQLSHDYDYYMVNKESMKRDDRQFMGEEILSEVKKNLMKDKSRVYDTYQGFDIILPAYMQQAEPHILLSGNGLGCYRISIKNSEELTPLGMMQKLDHFFNSMPDKIEKLNEKIRRNYQQISVAEEDIAKGNIYEQKVMDLMKELEEIDLKLSVLKE